VVREDHLPGNGDVENPIVPRQEHRLRPRLPLDRGRQPGGPIPVASLEAVARTVYEEVRADAMQVPRTTQEQGSDRGPSAERESSWRGGVFEIKERAGANPPGLVTSTDAEIGRPGRQEPRGFVNIPGQVITTSIVTPAAT